MSAAATHTVFCISATPFPPAAARAAAEEQRQAAEAAVAEAKVLRERCSQQGQAILQQQDKENQWKASAGLPACLLVSKLPAWQLLCVALLLLLPGSESRAACTPILTDLYLPTHPCCCRSGRPTCACLWK